MPSISSIKHPLFEELRSLRTIQGQQALSKFLVEEELIHDAIKAGYQIEHVFTVNKDLYSDKVPHYQINQGMMRKVYSQGRPPKAVAVCRAKFASLEEFKKKQFLVILENIQDPGNLGTMLRTCEAFGVEGVIIIGNDLTHLYNRITVRSAMGALFRLQISQADQSIVEDFLKENNHELIVTSPHAGQALNKAQLKRPVVVAFGNETDGVSPEMMKLATHAVSIPMAGSIESLNVAVCCGVVLYSLALRAQ